MDEQAKAHEEALIRWLKGKKDHPGIYPGEEPTPSDYWASPMTSLDVWYAERIRSRTQKEMDRTA